MICTEESLDYRCGTPEADEMIRQRMEERTLYGLEFNRRDSD